MGAGGRIRETEGCREEQMVTCLGSLSDVATGTAFCTSPACKESPTNHDTCCHACTNNIHGIHLRYCTAAAMALSGAEALGVPRRSCSEGSYLRRYSVGVLRIPHLALQWLGICVRKRFMCIRHASHIAISCF